MTKFSFCEKAVGAFEMLPDQLKLEANELLDHLRDERTQLGCGNFRYKSLTGSGLAILGAVREGSILIVDIEIGTSVNK